MKESADQRTNERQLMVRVSGAVGRAIGSLLAHKLELAKPGPIYEVDTHGWVRDVGLVRSGLSLQVWYDHYLGLDRARAFSVWLQSQEPSVIEESADLARVPVESRRTQADRTKDNVLRQPAGFLGRWFIDDWSLSKNFYFGRYSETGSAGHARDLIVKSLVADARTLLQGQPDVSPGPRTRPRRFKQSDEATMALVRARAGQGEFRRAVLEHFRGRCVVTGCDVEPALEAAHIVPYAVTGEQDPGAGLLLRADLHTLFDRGLWNIERRGGRAEVVLADELKGTVPYGTHEGPLPDESVLLQSHWAALAARQDGRQ